MKLSEFLTNMQDSEKLVSVTEYQLREFAVLSKGWENLSKEQSSHITKLQNTVDGLEAKIAVMELDQHETIDLFV